MANGDAKRHLWRCQRWRFVIQLVANHGITNGILVPERWPFGDVSAVFRVVFGRFCCTYMSVLDAMPCALGCCVCTLYITVFPHESFSFGNNGVVEAQRNSKRKRNGKTCYVVSSGVVCVPTKVRRARFFTVSGGRIQVRGCCLCSGVWAWMCAIVATGRFAGRNTLIFLNRSYISAIICIFARNKLRPCGMRLL